jgi:hypothetical protein
MDMHATHPFLTKMIRRIQLAWKASITLRGSTQEISVIDHPSKGFQFLNSRSRPGIVIKRLILGWN